MTRDYATISPSARRLLMVRAQASLPYARAAAVQLYGEDEVRRAADELAAHPGAARRARHFEVRAQSIDHVLAARGATRVVELGAGLSFRGLALCERAGVTYVDSDLPGIIDVKRELVAALHPEPLAGYRLVALDALDGAAFGAVVDALPPGPVAIVNEGLLMYLDDAEKTRLALGILDVLRDRGGAWVTADIYVRGETLYRDDATREFLAQHDVDAKKFADYAAAEAFFTTRGFAIAARLPSSHAPDHARETWVLTAA